MADAPAPLLTAARIEDRECPHCEAVTAQVVWGTTPVVNTCLQCIADGGTCCSIAQFNRWKPAPPE